MDTRDHASWWAFTYAVPRPHPTTLSPSLLPVHRFPTNHKCDVSKTQLLHHHDYYHHQAPWLHFARKGKGKHAINSSMKGRPPKGKEKIRKRKKKWVGLVGTWTVWTLFLFESSGHPDFSPRMPSDLMGCEIFIFINHYKQADYRRANIFRWYMQFHIEISLVQ